MHDQTKHHHSEKHHHHHPERHRHEESRTYAQDWGHHPHPERHHHDEGGPHGHGRGHHRGEGPGRGGRGGPGPGRAKRGEARFLLLDALREGPKHGYELIKTLEERSAGQYAPSPGTVYPTLQLLEDLGHVRADQGTERRVYHLTDAGRSELEAHAEEVSAFWARLTTPAASAASQNEIRFLQEELENLAQTVWGGLRSALERNDQETIRRIRQAVENSRNEIRNILANPGEPGKTESI